MKISSDKPFDWVAALALASGAAVIFPSLAVLAVTVLFVATLVLS